MNRRLWWVAAWILGGPLIGLLTRDVGFAFGWALSPALGPFVRRFKWEGGW